MRQYEMKNGWVRLFFFSLLIVGYASTSRGSEVRKIPAIKISAPIKIDGDLSDEGWKNIEPINRFIQFTPFNGETSPLKTEVKIVYDDKSIYFAFYCVDLDPENISASVTRRDAELKQDDAVIVMLDTFNDNRTCYTFGTNLLGTQFDGKVADNGRSEDDNWDESWQSAAKRVEDGWTAEISIPFSILKFKSGKGIIWGLNIGRNYPRTRELSFWAGPLEKENRVSQFGKLVNLDLQPKGRKYTFIPYALSQIQEEKKWEGKTGIDFRYRLTSNLGADITINPDFATIEADVEKINLTRFELRIPEKRPFFLEGSEYFRTRINQFYSRRIGDIPWGAKMTGKVGGWNLAIINAQSDPASSGSIPESEGKKALYNVIRTQRDVFGSSNIGLTFANRNYKGENSGSVGMDTTLFFTRTLGMTAQIVKSYGPSKDGTWAWFLRPAYDSATGHFHVRYSHWGEGLMENMNSIAYIRDDDRREVDSHLSKTFWIKKGWFEKIQFSTNYNQYWSQKGDLRSWDSSSRLTFALMNKWEIRLSHNEEFKRYEKDFRNRESSLNLGYDTRTGKSFSISYGIGRNYDNDMKVLRGNMQLKINDAWNVQYELTKLWLKPDLENRSTWIHLIRSNYYFNKDLFLKLFFQTNSILDKKNIQVVFVWRFLPPFGSLQLAYQKGTSKFGTKSDQGNTFFTKLSWVF